MTTFDFDNKKYDVRKPTLEQQREGQKVYNRSFNDAANSKAILREKLEDLMREQNLWDDAKQLKLKTWNAELSALELRLTKGGMKKTEAKNLCLKIRDLKAEIRNLLKHKMELDVHTCQGQADNARFNYYVSVCLVYNDTGKPVYSSLDDYLQHSSDFVAYTGAAKFADLYYGLDENYELNTIENKTLRKLGFVNDKLEFIDKDGNLVDELGRRINAFGQLINNDGKRVDEDGNLLDDKGDYVVETLPFLEDDGTPIEDKKEEAITV